MLFRGGGIGHQELHEFLKPFATDVKLDDVVIPIYDSNGDEIPASRDDSEEFDDEIEDSNDNQPGHGDDTSDLDEPETSEEEDLSTDEEWLDLYGPEDGDDGIDYLES